jgi:predicted ABC-type ATPase
VPRAVILAGPNGAGKSTLAPELLSQDTGIDHFLNTDLIAAGLSPLLSGPADVEAGKLMIQRLDHVVSQGEDFAVETTLSGTWLAKRIPRWRELGYRVELYYLWLSDSNIAIERVQRRVVQGGHDVPDADVRRRFVRGWRLFQSTYRDLVDVWVVYDVSGDTPVRMEGHIEE